MKRISTKTERNVKAKVKGNAKMGRKEATLYQESFQSKSLKKNMPTSLNRKSKETPKAKTISSSISQSKKSQSKKTLKTNSTAVFLSSPINPKNNNITT